MSIPSGQNEQNLAPIYNQMMYSIQHYLKTTSRTQQPSLQKSIYQAEQYVVLLGLASPAQAQTIAAYIKLDINDAAEYLMESSQDFSEWLMLDIDVVEQKVLQLFFSVANKTRTELERLNQLIHK